MKGYLIVDIEITDPQRYAQYIEVVPATLAKYGGKYLARGGRTEKLEGEHDPKRVVIVEFPSFERAQEWWSCDDYRAPKLLRQSAAITSMVLVEGV